MRRQFRLLAVAGLLLTQGLAWGAEPVAVLTEIQPGQGTVHVRRAGGLDWNVPQPLLALRPGDEIRVFGDGLAVIVFTGARGTQTVSQVNSPFTVHAPTGQTLTDSVQALVASITRFLLGQKEVTYPRLYTRYPPTLTEPLLILFPRETRSLTIAITFEWTGPTGNQYTLRVFGPQGLLWEKANLPRRPLTYPPEAPALRAGSRYTWELETMGHPGQRAQFEILSASEAARVQAALALLQPAKLPEYRRNTLVVMRAGLLFQEGLYSEARKELLAAITADPIEPTLHFFLGRVYEQVGLKDLAAEAFEEAYFLSTPKP